VPEFTADQGFIQYYGFGERLLARVTASQDLEYHLANTGHYKPGYAKQWTLSYRLLQIVTGTILYANQDVLSSVHSRRKAHWFTLSSMFYLAPCISHFCLNSHASWAGISNSIWPVWPFKDHIWINSCRHALLLTSHSLNKSTKMWIHLLFTIARYTEPSLAYHLGSFTTCISN